MDPHAMHTMIENELAGELSGLEKQIFEALKQHPAGLTRPELLLMIYQEKPEGSLANNVHDRMIRKTIQRLRERLIPIVSTSREAGYRLDTSPTAVHMMIAEMQARVEALQDRIRQAHKFYQVPETFVPATKATQSPLL